MKVRTSAGPAEPPRETGQAPIASVRRRVALWLVIGVTLTWWAIGVAYSIVRSEWTASGWWLLSASYIAAATIVVARRPAHPSAPWLVATVAAFPVAEIGLIGFTAANDSGSPAQISMWNTVTAVLGLITPLAIAHVVGLFPSGVPSARWQSVTLRAIWIVLIAPIVVLFLCGEVVPPAWMGTAPIPNPFAIAAVLDVTTARVILEVASGIPVLVAAALFVARYVQADHDGRRGMRWLIVPVTLVPIAAVAGLASATGADFGSTLLLDATRVLISFAFSASFVAGILQPRGANPDRALRGTLTYAVLWAVIATLFIVMGAVVGTAAGEVVPITWAVVIAMAVAVAFQPARSWLERLVDRRLFGRRPDPEQMVVALGDALAQTEDLAALLPRIAETLKAGMGLRWVRVQLHPDPDRPDPSETPALVVPIEVDGERIGRIECGPKETGELRPREVEVIRTFARQAAMAVRNVRLNTELAHQADMLRESRNQLLRAQEDERRRIERNIHDGVQQDLTALMGITGRVRDDTESGRGPSPEDLELVQEGLRRVLDDVRALAQGIHPTVLTDRGLLEAIETLAARHPVPVTVRADTRLRAIRLPAAMEGAAYFTVAEALANSLKHASASRITVALSLRDHVLRVRASDNGVGLDPSRATGSGLTNLHNRVTAVGGTLAVTGTPGAGTEIEAEFAVDGTFA